MFYLSWGGGRWKSNEYPDSIFEDIPEGGLPIKKIYVDEEGKLAVQYEDGEDEEEE